MQGETYKLLQQKERERKIAKLLAVIIVASLPFILGFIVGRVTKHTVETPETVEQLQEYHPDPCGLNVVICEGEEGYNAE